MDEEYKNETSSETTFETSSQISNADYKIQTYLNDPE